MVALLLFVPAATNKGRAVSPVVVMPMLELELVVEHSYEEPSVHTVTEAV